MSRWPEGREHKHPSRRCYIRHGCKCDGCRKTNAQYHRARRANLRANAVPDVLPQEEVKRIREMMGIK